VDQLAGRDVALEAQKFLVPVALDALTDRHPIEQVERRKQTGRGMANIIVSHVPARPRFIGKPGWVRSSAWVWLFCRAKAPLCAGKSSKVRPHRAIWRQTAGRRFKL
jgi:hypothetical protein